MNRVEVHTAEVLAEIEQRTRDLLELSGEIIHSKAEKAVPIDTGFLRGTITHKLNKNLLKGDLNPGIEFTEKRGKRARRFLKRQQGSQGDSNEHKRALPLLQAEKNKQSLSMVVGANAKYAIWVEKRIKPFLEIALRRSLTPIKVLWNERAL